MSDLKIDNMNFKQLKSEVQSLRDELAMMKRKYEDILYNIGDENFSSTFIREKNSMRTQISVNAQGIETKVSRSDLKGELEGYSTIEQTADAITSVVSKKASLDNAQEVTGVGEMTDKDKVYVIRNKKNGATVSEEYYYFNTFSEKWEILSGENIHTVFEQTPDGFNMKGNVVIDGETVITKNLKLSGNVTWDMENSPVKTRYSVDGGAWHEYMQDGDMYMQMSFDGGVNWSNSVKVVGSDGSNGQDGENGQDASVTPENVFNALTDNGAQQGIFAAFVNNENQLYINATFINSGVLSGIQIISEDEAGNTVDIQDGRIFFKPTGETGNPKMRFGYGDVYSDYAPYIMMGAGTNDTIEYSAGIPFKKGAATLFKDQNSFNIAFKDSTDDGNIHGIHFYDKDTGFSPHIGITTTNLDLSGCGNIDWGDNKPVAVFG